jgi:phosphate transport system substrate-binding protein
MKLVSIAMLLCTIFSFESLALQNDSLPLRIHGSNTLSNQIFRQYESEIKSKVKTPYNIIGNGSSRGLEDVSIGKADIAMISTPIEELKVRLKDVNWNSFSNFYIGQIKVAFIVNKDNPVKSLTIKQISKILSGQISNWVDLGGDNEDIVVITEYYGGGVRSMTEKKLLINKSISAKTVQTKLIKDVAMVVASVPAAFGIANVDSNLKIEGINIVKTDKELIIPFYFLTLGNPSPRIEAFIKAIQSINFDNRNKLD